MLERKVICKNCGEDYPPVWPHSCTASDRPAGYKATTDKNKLSGCKHEDGSGWCTAGEGVVCEDANRCPDGSIGCNRAL